MVEGKSGGHKFCDAQQKGFYWSVRDTDPIKWQKVQDLHISNPMPLTKRTYLN